MLTAYWVEHRFRAMGSECHLVLGDAPDGLADWAEREATRLERAWSRFDPASDLCALNSSPQTQVETTPLMIEALTAAQRLHRATDGLFDVTILNTLESWGYDRPFTDLASLPRRERHDGRIATLDGPRVELSGTVVSRPVGLRIDLGGIGKGLAADRIADGLVDRGARTVLVSMGGDLRAAGQPPDGGWRIPVEDPRDPTRTLVEWELSEGALVTSTTMIRRWSMSDGGHHRDSHHLIDPTTGSPSSSGLCAAIVAAPEAWWAEGLAKAAVISGAELGAALLTRHGVRGLLVGDDGFVTDVTP